ncbi:MAG: flagellar biosynthesis protein FlhF [Burkholderiaceae bacterium]|nr:flagellar biosynthesis protein FlhF [Burkholderiaceae bacterium]
MNIRTFVAATPRDALRAARAALGEQAVVLSNRTVAAGTELMVMAPDDMQALLAQPAAPLAPAPAPVPQALQHELKDELRSMRGLLESQLATLAWNGRQPEAKARALREMLAAGFSAGLSRYIAEHMPAAAMESEQAGRGWMRDILGRNLPVLDSDDCLLERGGVFALVGPTGVGKTTSTAKLAARCVARHGAARIALVTTDGYRIGAFEQLRIYGKLLGVMVHSVRDAADLAIALEEMKHKHIVLIDTAGASQRDSMVAEQIAMLASGSGRVQRLLCLNTTSTAETLDEVVRAYRGDGLAGCLLTKLDEASGIGGALDVAIRHKLPLSFIADGQRVPEDLHLADRRQLLERAFTSHADAKVFGLTNHDLPLVAANSAQAMRDPLLSEVQLG